MEAVQDGTAAQAAVAGSSADEYDDVAAVRLAVAVTDDEGTEIVVSRSGELALMESTGTTSATYTVWLSVASTGPVTVGVTSDDAGADADAPHERMTVTPTRRRGWR